MQVSETMELSAWSGKREGSTWLCPELAVVSQGKSVEEALTNLREALELYFEDEDVEKPEQIALFYVQVADMLVL